MIAVKVLVAMAPLASAAAFRMGLIKSKLSTDGSDWCIQGRSAMIRTPDDFTALGMAVCDDGDERQIFAFDSKTGGIWTLSSGERMQVRGGANAVKTEVVLSPRAGDGKGAEHPSMRWSYDEEARNIIWDGADGRCLEWAFAEDGRLRTYAVHGGRNQQWEFEEVRAVFAERMQIRSRDKSQGEMCLTATGLSGALRMLGCSDDKRQQWKRNANTGEIFLADKIGDYVLLDMAMGRTTVGNTVQTWGSRRDPAPDVIPNGNKNMWFDYYPQTGRIHWRFHQDRAITWDKNTNSIVSGAVDEFQPMKTPSEQQFDFVVYEESSTGGSLMPPVFEG